MAKECLQGCPVIEAIKKNAESGTLPEFFNNGLHAARKDADHCQGPKEIAVAHQEGFLLWTKTVIEPRAVCGNFETSQTGVFETPQPDLQTEPNAVDGYFETPRTGVFETPQPAQQLSSALPQLED